MNTLVTNLNDDIFTNEEAYDLILDDLRNDLEWAYADLEQNINARNELKGRERIPYTRKINKLRVDIEQLIVDINRIETGM